MAEFTSLCQQFAEALGGKSKMGEGVCTVSFHRNFQATVQRKPSKTVMPAGVLFESLDQNGNALNLAEIALLEQEIPVFMQAVVQQGLIVSALHNHWLFTNPTIMYIHIQSVEPPVDFAQKMAYAFTLLSSYPVAE